MLPFVFDMKPLDAFAFLIGMLAVTSTTGDITSILFGVPGESISAALGLDGHQMAKNGEAGRALGAALMSSLIGALIGAFVLAAVGYRSLLLWSLPSSHPSFSPWRCLVSRLSPPLAVKANSKEWLRRESGWYFPWSAWIPSRECLVTPSE